MFNFWNEFNFILSEVPQKCKPTDTQPTFFGWFSVGLHFCGASEEITNCWHLKVSKKKLLFIQFKNAFEVVLNLLRNILIGIPIVTYCIGLIEIYRTRLIITIYAYNRQQSLIVDYVYFFLLLVGSMYVDLVDFKPNEVYECMCLFVYVHVRVCLWQCAFIPYVFVFLFLSPNMFRVRDYSLSFKVKRVLH